MNDKKKKILIADDDAAILDALTLLLNEEGYEVSATTDGKSVKEMKDEFPDLILLDLWMSGIDGNEICTFLKNNTETQHIPIIILSANKDALRIARDCGADDFIAKPFEMSELYTKISKYLKDYNFE